MSKYENWKESLQQFKDATSEVTLKLEELEIAPQSADSDSVMIRRIGKGAREKIILTKIEAAFVVNTLTDLYK